MKTTIWDIAVIMVALVCGALGVIWLLQAFVLGDPFAPILLVLIGAVVYKAIERP